MPCRFQEKYSSYQPYALRNDRQLTPDLVRVSGIIAGLSELVRTGDLHEAHLGLETVYLVFQETFKRNGFSMLSVALVDFHDAMEAMLDAANAKEPAKVVVLYPQVSEKLRTVEAESNDVEIQAIRKNLDEVNELAKVPSSAQLQAKGEASKSSFIEVYLARG